MVNFKLSIIPAKTGIAGFFQSKWSLSNFSGATTYGERGMSEAYFSRGDEPTIIEGGLKNLVMNVYLNPRAFNDKYGCKYTVLHESGHIYFGADYVKRNLPIPNWQHDKDAPESMPYHWPNY